MKPIRVDSEKVITLCKHTLDAITRIHVKQNKLLLLKYKRSWKKYVFFGRIITETSEQTEERLRANFHYPTQWLNQTYQNVQAIMDAAKLVESLMLSQEDLSELLHFGRHFLAEIEVDKELAKYEQN